MLEAGNAIVIRDLWRGRLWDAVPVVVIDHTERWLTEHQVPGTVMLAKTCRGSEKLDALEAGTWDLATSTSTEPGLNFYEPDGWTRIGLSWSRDYSTFGGWYVNFQRPLAQSRFGFDTMDLVLDARVSPTRQWTWKDEDDFADALTRGLIDSSIERAVRREAERVRAMAEAEQGPFDRRWLDWRPSRDFTPPVLPPGVAIP